MNGSTSDGTDLRLAGLNRVYVDVSLGQSCSNASLPGDYQGFQPACQTNITTSLDIKLAKNLSEDMDGRVEIRTKMSDFRPLKPTALTGKLFAIEKGILFRIEKSSSETSLGGASYTHIDMLVGCLLGNQNQFTQVFLH